MASKGPQVQPFAKESCMPIHAWEDITKQIEQEPDPAKIATLAKKLNEAMIAEERAK